MKVPIEKKPAIGRLSIVTTRFKRKDVEEKAHLKTVVGGHCLDHCHQINKIHSLEGDGVATITFKLLRSLDSNFGCYLKYI